MEEIIEGAIEVLSTILPLSGKKVTKTDKDKQDLVKEIKQKDGLYMKDDTKEGEKE